MEINETKLSEKWINKIISKSTLGIEKIIPKYIKVIDTIMPDIIDHLLKSYRFSRESDFIVAPYSNREYDLHDLNETLENWLQEIAPIGCRFGIKNGDIGFWIENKFSNKENIIK